MIQYKVDRFQYRKRGDIFDGEDLINCGSY